LDCADTDTELSLHQLKRRVEKLEKKSNRSQQTKPKLSTCLKFLLLEAKHWHNIGSLLEISEQTLEQIEADYPGDCQQCVREMIKSWLKQVDPPPSWKDLAEAVQIINPDLAKKILNCATVDTIMK
jgi:BMFP domain-containing protein YqiC